MRTLLQIVVLLTGTLTAARADVTLVLDNPHQTGMPGLGLLFFGTIANTGVDTVFLNSDDLDLTGPSDLSITDLFFANVPISVGGGMTSGDIELFDVSISDPFPDPAGPYVGSYTVTGGADGGSANILATTDFSVTVTVPEPGSWELLASTVSGLLLASRVRLRRILERNVAVDLVA